MHEYSFEQYRAIHSQPLPQRRGQRLAIAAPRGSAKSTVHSLLLPLMDILYQREKHIVIVSATQQQAYNRLANITRELRNNAALHAAFFQGQMPDLQSSRRCLMANDVRIEAYGCGAEMRGISYGEYRPTRIILDDVEASRNAVAVFRRQQLLQWYDEVVENLGDLYTHITIVGTILHRSSLLSQLLDRANYRRQTYKSISRWSRRPDLWAMWRQLYVDMSDPGRDQSADAFFARHKAEMLDGTEVLWPGKETYADLQKLRLTIGRAAFAKEKQNAPFGQDHRVFDTQRWTRFIAPDGRIELVKPALQLFSDLSPEPDLFEDEPPALASVAADRPGAFSLEQSRPLPHLKDLKYYGFLDPALGRATTRDGDFAAIVTVGRDGSGIFYVVDVWMEKATPSQQIRRAFELHAHYNYVMFGYEANGFQESLGSALRQESRKQHEAGKGASLPLRPRQHMENKRARICCLEPPIVAGSIRFQNNLPEEFYTQADEFGAPRCHDDGLDALAGCIDMIRELDTGISGLKTIRRASSGGF